VGTIMVVAMITDAGMTMITDMIVTTAGAVERCG
jgi:hypothetical protein